MWVKIILLRWVVLGLITLTTNSQDIPDVTLISYKSAGTKYHMDCVVNGSTDSALAWNVPFLTEDNGATNRVSVFKPPRSSTYNCDINFESEACNYYWAPKDDNIGWKLQKSLDSTLKPVTDRRWEEFKTYYTSGENKFLYITYLKNLNFTIHVSIRIKEGAHIYLCSNKYPPYGKCYWILLGGFNGSSSLIRRCANEKVPQKGFPKSDCRKNRDKINHDSSDPILNVMEWRHFTIVRVGKTISLWQAEREKPLLTYYDQESFITTPYLSIKSGDTSGYWKFHDYAYTFTNYEETVVLGEDMYVPQYYICITMFVAMCSRCNLILQLTENSILWETIIQPKQVMAWQEVKYVIRMPNVRMSVRLRAISKCIGGECNNPFWALDNFQICNENEVRVLSILGDRDKASCQLIKYPQRHLYQTEVRNDIVSEIECGLGKFGNKCIDCYSVLGLNNILCEYTIICDMQSDGQSVCTCARGSTGTDCKKKCDDNWYGSGCTQRCGYCTYLPCNHITGACEPHSCANNFSDIRCKTPPYPVFLNPPAVTDVGNTYLEVQIQNNLYEGEGEPAYYTIQYRDESQSQTEWKQKEMFLYTHTSPIKISNLNISTRYAIRAVLFTSDNDYYMGSYVRIINATTTCENFKSNDITVESRNISASIHFKTNAESCRISDFEMVLNGNISLKTAFNFDLIKLVPASTYYLTITNKIFSTSVTKEFITTDGVSQPVEELTATNQRSTSMTISWKQPLITNGNIRYYNIQYKHIKYMACGSAEQNAEEVFVESVSKGSTSVEIINLHPYSEYSIEVVAVTIMDGLPSTINSYTLQTDSLEESETPTIKAIEPEATKATVILEQPNCVLIKGPVVYYVTVECSNNWCLQNSENCTFINNDNGKPILLTKLQAYCNYTLKIKVGRKNGNVFNGREITQSFNTKTSAPHEVTSLTAYSKDESSISLRFLPPFPPTGEIELYCFKYCWPTYNVFGYKNGEECDNKNVNFNKCKLWNNFHCATITKLEANQMYIVEVRAKNTDTNYGLPESINVLTVQQAPGILENFTAIWDDYYNLTVTWNHPSVTNGPLTKFIVTITAKSDICYQTDFPISEENYTNPYYYTISFKKCYASILNIRAAACNIQEGPPLTIVMQSPPKTPSFSKEPSVEAITNTTITIKIPAPKDLEKNSSMYVIVSTTNLNLKNTDNDVVMPEICKNINLPSNAFSWVAAEYDFTKLRVAEQVLVIGDDSRSKSTKFQKKEIHNQVLDTSTTYMVYIAIFNEFMSFKRCNVVKIEASTSSIAFDGENENESSNSLFALILLFVIPILLFIFLYRRKKKNHLSWGSVLRVNINSGPNSLNPDVIPLEATKKKTQTGIPQSQLRPKRVLPADGGTTLSQPSTSAAVNTFSKPVKIIEFEKYVKESIENGELEKQHQLFPRGQTKPWDYGLLPQNKSKNRYNNLIAYDHSRVKLVKINNDPYSDYINANYIEGYNTKKAYIATQGPKVSTVNDFWRMIWQENVNHIIMLANIIEAGKKKTEQYWPNINEQLEFGNIKVDYVSSRVFADYEYRTFSVFYKNEERKVEQLHFTSWPDHAVPLYSQSLVPFLRKILTIPQGNSPIVVHCSAGVGRTGTIILCDLCLRMAAREGVVDVLKHQFNLREQRANLVDNIEQYKLAHLVLLECLIAPHTSISCDEEMEATVLRLLETERVGQQMLYLQETAWQDQAMRPPLKVVPFLEWKSKNRSKNIIPSGYGRVYLSRYPPADEHSDYINAVEVDGFRFPQRFIVTQQPLPNTISDFWRMIDEKEVTTVVSLNKINLGDETSCVFWPTAKVSEIQPVPFITLQFHNKSTTDHYSIITIYLHNKKDKKNVKRTIISLIILKGWPSNKLLPDEEESLLKLWEETERISRGNSPIVVTCYDGAKACGLFLALSFVVEKMKLEQECDVCLAVRTVRHNRNEFVTEIDQFLFLYRAAMKYLSCFDLYSNFTPAGKK